MTCPLARQITRRSGSNFYYSFLFLPAPVRAGIYAVYAFARVVDDAVDEAPDAETARRAVRHWRAELAAVYERGAAGGAEPLMAEVAETIRRFDIPREYLEDLVTGVEMDLTVRRYATFAALEKYCYHVAGTIGLICNCLFGARDERARRYAITLGTAFQLTNILRDVASDAARGRIYVPTEELSRFGYTEADLLARRATPAFFELMRFQAERAERYFQEAHAILPPAERRRLVAAEIMDGVYHRILRKIAARPERILRGKATLPKWEKGGIALAAWWRAKRS